MERHCKNALRLAQFLEQHSKIEKTIYPFLHSHPQYELAQKQLKAGGGIVTFNIAGNQEDAFRFINSLHIPSITSNLGDSRTIVTHPRTTTHSRMTEESRQATGIQPQTIRLSVGLEDIEDIISDINQALAKV